MTCDSEYQSKICCEISEFCEPPTHSLIVPQVHIGTRPRASSVPAWTARSDAAISTKVHAGILRVCAAKTSVKWTNGLVMSRGSLLLERRRAQVFSVTQVFSVSIVTLRLV